MGLKKLFNYSDIANMKLHTIFASGLTDKILFGQEVRWVAVRLSDASWSIYYAHKNVPIDKVMTVKRRLLAKSLIKELVPCTPQLFSKYFL